MTDRRPTISRRTLLRGLGTVAIGLPLLEEMLLSPRAAVALPANVPTRAFNVFFGLGIPTPVQRDGFNGVLEPLKPLKDRLLIMQEVDQVRTDEGGSNAHYDGSAGAFTAMAPNGTAKAGGPSIDQVIRHGVYPQGQPAGVIPTLVAGTFFRRNRTSRYTHSWGLDGTVAATAQESPRELFDRVFGALPSGGGDDERKKRLKRSVLDSVLTQYNHYTQANSPLGAASRADFKDHLDRIREYEQRAFEMEEEQQQACRAPSRPASSNIAHGDPADPGGEGIDITVDALVSEWRLLADIYALAIQCDRVRFGNITFLAAGERIRLTGEYKYDGRTIYDFDDSRELGTGGSRGCSHEWWHRFNESRSNEQLRAHAHLKMREVAYFLQKLDGPDARDANGKSILENALITISTESGDGRHNDVRRELSGVFHATTSAGGALKTGQVMELNAEGLDVYNTILQGMGVQAKMGPQSREVQQVSGILA